MQYISEQAMSLDGVPSESTTIYVITNMTDLSGRSCMVCKCEASYLKRIINALKGSTSWILDDSAASEKLPVHIN